MKTDIDQIEKRSGERACFPGRLVCLTCLASALSGAGASWLVPHSGTNPRAGPTLLNRNMSEKKATLSVTDNRTGRSVEVDIIDGTIPAIALRQFKTSEDDFGLMAYDPGFTNTASCRSRITVIDGDRGILEHRGIRIEDLAGKRLFEEVALLLVDGVLPTEERVRELREAVLSVPKGLKAVLENLPRTAHPMTVLQALVASMPAFVDDAGEHDTPEVRRRHAIRLIAAAPILGAWAGRHAAGLPFVEPRVDLSLAANLLRCRFAPSYGEYVVDPVMERAMDALMVLHADHEQNCSTATMRGVGSSHADPYAAAAAAVGALSGPLHGGANEAVLRMLDAIVEQGETPATFIEKAKKGEQRLMGFGHRVYKAYDPRARALQALAHEVFATAGGNEKVRIAVELERLALADDYFVKRRLYPNVDFYSGIVYSEAIGFRREELTVLFAAARMAGWVAQWLELRLDPEQKIARPRQVYTGPRAD